MTKKTIHNVLTGEIQTIDMSPEEEQYVIEKKERSKNEVAQHQAKLDEQATLKDSAKAKLIAGEALTEDEANTIVL